MIIKCVFGYYHVAQAGREIEADEIDELTPEQLIAAELGDQIVSVFWKPYCSDLV